MIAPYFHSWHDFFAMGGYGVFVWSAYGITAFVMGLNIILPVIKRRQLKTRLK